MLGCKEQCRGGTPPRRALVSVRWKSRESVRLKMPPPVLGWHGSRTVLGCKEHCRGEATRPPSTPPPRALISARWKSRESVRRTMPPPVLG